VVALNHDDCVDMVGHGDLRIDRHILVMTAQIFLLRFRKRADRESRTSPPITSPKMCSF